MIVAEATVAAAAEEYTGVHAGSELPEGRVEEHVSGNPRVQTVLPRREWRHH